MATGNIQSVDSVGQLTSLLGMLKGSSSSQTTTPNISSEGMNAVLNQILGSANGLAAVSSQGRSSGLYNSSTQQLLNNNYIATTAGELAKQRAGSTTTSKKDASLGGKDLLALIGLSAGKSLLGPAVSGAVKKSGVDQFGNKLADSLGLGSSSSGVAVDSGSTNLFGSDTSSSFSNVGGLADSLSSFGNDTGSAVVDETGTNLFAGAAGDASSTATDTVTSSVADEATDEGGSFLGSLLICSFI